MFSIRSRPLKYSLISLAVLVVLCGLLIGAFQIAVSRVPEYRGDLQNWLSDKTGLAIEFKSIGARLRLYGPELVFNDAIVRTPDRTRVLATAQRGSVAFDLWNSIRSRHLTAGRFTLDSPEIGLIRTSAGHIQLVGQSALPDHEMAKPISVESLPIGQINIRNALVSFRDEVTGRGPWSLSGISFNLDRQPELLELHGNASLPHALGQALEFSARVAGSLDDVDALVSDFALEGHGLDLAGWADVLPDRWLAPETGHGSIELATQFNGVRPTGMTVRLALANVSAVSPAWLTPLPQPEPLVMKADDDEPQPSQASAESAIVEPEPAPPEPHANPATDLISFDRLAIDVQASRHDDQWVVQASNVDLSRKDSPWRADRIEVKWTPVADGGLSFAFDADRLVLDNLWPLLAYLPESKTVAQLRSLHAHGAVDNLSLNIERVSAAQPVTYGIKADIRNVGFSPVAKVPGLSGLTAHVEGTDASGAIRLESQDVDFTLPRMFRDTLNAQSIAGVVNWERGEQGWRLSSDELRVITPAGKAQAKIAVTVPTDRSSPVLELVGQGTDLDVAATPRYLPANKFTPKALAWLDAAFAGGRVASADVTFKGPVRAFPFRRGEGQFIARGQIDDVTFNYQPGWAPAEQVHGVVEFRNEGMRLLSGTAAIGGLKVANIRGDFVDFKTGNLNVQAQATGDLGDALTLLQNSPLREALGDQFQTLHGQGGTRAEVNLHLPLKHMEDRRVLITTHLADARVTSSQLDAPVTQLNGFLTVRQTLPEEAELHGQWLGAPLEVVIRPVDAAVQSAQLTAKGHAEAAQLTSLLHVPASVKTSGAADWQLTTLLETASAQNTTPRQPRKFTIESYLQGFGIGLPYPVGKTEAEARRLQVDIEYDGDRTLLTRAALGDVRALMRLRQHADGWRFDRGGVRPDGIAAALPVHSGLGVEGSLDKLNLDDWFALKGNASGTTSVSDYLQSVNLRIGSLQIFGYQFPDVRGVLRTEGSAWRINVAGPSAEGELTIPWSFTGTQPLQAQLDRLIITREGRESGQQGNPDPRSWPNLQLTVQDLRYEEHPIGAVTLQASRVSDGIRIDEVTLVQDALRGEAHGEWLVTPEGERSKLSTTVTSTDVAATLRALNYTPFMEAKHGEVTANLSWPGGFDSKFPGRASGNITVAVENGQLLNVQPGAGRVLGLFSVSALPRRLSLDFSDLTDKGLSFDTVHGDFELRDGNAYTSNLLLRGPAAEIGIAGRTGLGARDYDQTAVVTGNLGASLPVAGALAAGPAVGAALLLFSQVFKEPLKGMTRGYYRITGPWDNPVVERVDAAEIKQTRAAEAHGAERG